MFFSDETTGDASGFLSQAIRATAALTAAAARKAPSRPAAGISQNAAARHPATAPITC